MSFRNYKESRDADLKVDACVRLFVEGGVDPHGFIESFLEDHDLSEDWKSWWGGITDFARGVGRAAFGGSFHDEFTKAKNAMTDLQKFLASNEQAKALKSKNNPAMGAADYISSLLKQLEGEVEIAQVAKDAQTPGHIASDTTPAPAAAPAAGGPAPTPAAPAAGSPAPAPAAPAAGSPAPAAVRPGTVRMNRSAGRLSSARAANRKTPVVRNRPMRRV